MNFQLLCNFVMLLLLNSFIQLNAVPHIIISPEANSSCSQVAFNPSEDNSLYSHSQIFGTAATLKDTEAFKYYCTNDLILSTISRELVRIIFIAPQ